MAPVSNFNLQQLACIYMLLKILSTMEPRFPTTSKKEQVSLARFHCTVTGEKDSPGSALTRLDDGDNMKTMTDDDIGDLRKARSLISGGMGRLQLLCI